MNIDRKYMEWNTYALLCTHKNKVANAIERVKAAAGKATFALAWSGGKDSTAMAHLVKSILPNTPLVVQFDDCDWPEKKPYIKRVAAANDWDFHSVYPDFSVWETMKRGGIGTEAFCSKSNNLTKDSFLKPLFNKRVEIGMDGYFIGLRAKESKYRMFNYLKRGDTYRLKDGEWHSYPVIDWEVIDVFAYLASHDIEINPLYLNNGLKEPEEVRLSWACPTPSGMGYGDMENFRKNFPKKFQELRAMGVE